MAAKAVCKLSAVAPAPALVLSDPALLTVP